MADDALNALSRGTIAAIFNPSGGQRAENPVYQCLHIKPMGPKPGDTGSDRYRVILSDGEFYVQAMMGTSQQNPVADGSLKKQSIVRLDNYSASVVSSKRIIIVPSLEILTQYGEPDRLGAPVNIDTQPALPDGVINLNGPEISGNSFYGNAAAQAVSKPAPKPAPAASRPSAPAPARPGNNDSGYSNLYPIEALSPYAHKWTIRARVTAKTPMRHWHNSTGDGRLFSVNLLDESGEIRATVFHSVGDIFDQWYELFQEGQVYYISNPCQVKFAKKQFTQINNDYELAFERDTKVEKAADQGAVPQIRYNFTPIGDLANVEKDTTIDTIGILQEVEALTPITSKTTHKTFNKRELTVVDDTMHKVRLTIWGETAQNFDVPLNSVIAFKGVKVSDFGGKSLSLLSSGSITVDPDINEAHKLKGWYDAQGQNQNFVSHSSAGTMGTTRNDKMKTIQEVRDEGLGMSEQADYFTLKATVVYIRQDENRTPYYEACRSPDCNRKVEEVDHDPVQWHCNKCDKRWDEPERRYILGINVADHTGSMWLDVFDDTGKLLMGMSADEYHKLDKNQAKQALEDATCKSFVFRCRAKQDMYQDTPRHRISVSSANPINYAEEALRLADIIKQYNINDNDGLFVT